MDLDRARRAFVVAAALAASFVPSAASAQTWTHADPVEDVVRVDNHGGYEVVNAWTNTSADVRKVSSAHTSSSLAIRLVLRGKLPATGWDLSYDIRTPQSKYYLTFHRFKTYRGLELFRSGHGRVRCPGLARTISNDPVANVKVVVPRSCIGNPRYVRFSAVVSVQRSVDWTYVDDALDEGYLTQADVLFSRRLYRN